MKQRQIQLAAIILILGLVTSACFFGGSASKVKTPVPTDTLFPLSIASDTPEVAETATTRPTQTAAPIATSVPLSIPQGTGPKIVTGSVIYTNTFFTAGVAEPEILLEDEGGFITRNRKFIIPIASQVIGQITSDFYKSPFTYSLSLPAEPNGTLHNVSHDGKNDKGVMVFAVAYWTNTWGDPYLEKRDQGGGGWSTAYASTRVSENRDSYLEVTGGKYLVYAPDDQEKFPSGFGADKKLFTDDDPTMSISAGWSVIDMDKTPFAIDLSENPVIDLIEPQTAALDDFSKLSYTDAFDKMIQKFTKQYAWTDLKHIDWTAKATQFRPLFVQAQAAKDKHAYALALRDFLWSIPDTHIGFDESLLTPDFQADTAGGLGFAMRETDDKKIVANYILAGSSADKAGMKWGAQIISLDGQPVSDVVDDTVPWSSPFSNPIVKRLQQLRYALRFQLDKGSVKVTFINPGSIQTTATLPVVKESTSFNFSSFRAGATDHVLPVEYKLLPGGYGYISINSFEDNDVLSIQIWERALRYFIQNKAPGIILDMRINGGGSGWLADQMAAYFFDKETVVGNVAHYNEGSGAFYMDPGDQTSMIPPPTDLQYSGPVAVLVGPACASACEFFSYDMTINNRASIVGEYPSEGAGGSVEDFMMPENISVQLTTGRAVDAQGNIHLEGKGVVPTVKVPVTLDTLKKEANGEDVVLEAAENFLLHGALPGAGIKPAGAPKIASSTDAESAIKAGTVFLEDKAREKPDPSAFSKPGTITYTIPLISTDSVIWAYAWCAKDTTTLQKNIGNIQLTFILDGQDVTSQMASISSEANGMTCEVEYTLLSNWPAGEHHLTITAKFITLINDGVSDFPAGNYVLDYSVFVKP